MHCAPQCLFPFISGSGLSRTLGLAHILFPLRVATPDSSPPGHRMLLLEVPALTVTQVEHTGASTAAVEAKRLCKMSITTSLVGRCRRNFISGI